MLHLEIKEDIMTQPCIWLQVVEPNPDDYEHCRKHPSFQYFVTSTHLIVAPTRNSLLSDSAEKTSLIGHPGHILSI